MRRTQRLIFFSVLFLCGYSSKAQFRLYAGPQLTTANYSIRNAHQQMEAKTGFMAGVGLTTFIEGPVYFAPSLYFSQKGYKVEFDRPGAPPDSAAKNNNTTINTIAFAPLLQFNLSKAQSHLFVRFGPGIDVAVSGREIFDSLGGKRVDRSMQFSSVAYSPATAYANVQIGFQHQNGLSIFAHYEHGLSSLNNADFGPIILHRVVGVSVGWNVGKK